MFELIGRIAVMVFMITSIITLFMVKKLSDVSKISKDIKELGKDMESASISQEEIDSRIDEIEVRLDKVRKIFGITWLKENDYEPKN